MPAVQKELHPQVLQRTYRKALDQHGRKWGANIDSRTHDPVERLRPEGWDAPYIPAPEFVKWRYDAEEGRYSVFIDYDADIRARELALREWEKELVRVGLKVNGTAFDARRPSAEVMALVGPRPEPKEIPLAAKAGEPWVLGKTDKRPGWAHKFFVDYKVDPYAFMHEEAEGEEEAEAVVAPVKRGPGRPRKAASTE